MKRLIILLLVLAACAQETEVLLPYGHEPEPPLAIPEEPMVLETPETNMNTIVEMETTLGSVTIELFTETMPITAGNFEKLVREGFYDGIIFHRVIPNFMIQGGDPTGTGTGDPGYKIKDEFTASNKNTRGTLSMANAGPNTGGSQFFINVVDNNFLDGKHPVFGKVTNGMDVVDKISLVERSKSDRPIEEVKIVKASIRE